MLIAKRVRGLLCAAALSALVLTVPGCARRTQTVVLVTVAGLRADSVAAGQAPAIRSLGARGIVLDNLYTTAPDPVIAAASLMTGEDPDRLGMRWGDLARLPAAPAPLAEKLNGEKFVTAAFVGQREISALTGLARGFSTWVAAGSPALMQAIAADEFDRVRRPPLAAPALAGQAASWLATHAKDRRVFLWVHFGDIPAAVSIGADPKAAYLASVREVDAAVKTLVEAVARERGEDGVVVGLVSLYGLALGEGGETLAGLTLPECVVRTPGFLVGAKKGAAPAGPASLAQFAGMLEAARGAAPAQSPAAAPVLVASFLSSREYGWPPTAMAGDAEGWLRLDPAPRWIAAGGRPEVAGDAAWREAPAALRERLEAAGLKLGSGGAPDIPGVLRLMGGAKHALTAGDAEGAIRQLEQGVQAAPDGMAPRLTLLQVLRSAPADEQERRKAEIASLVDSLKGLVGDDAGRRLDASRALAAAGRKEEALALLRRLTAGGANAGELVAVVYGFAAVGAEDEALSLAERLSTESPGAAELHELLGDLLNKEGNSFRARESYEKAVACVGGRTPDILAKLGDVLTRLGEKDAALGRYAEAVRVDPTYRYPHARAADILVAKGDYGRAADAVVKSLPVTGDPADDAYARFEALFGRRLLKAAAQVLEEGLKKRPDDPRLILAFVHVLVEAGATGAARPRLDAFLLAHPEDPYALVELARLEAVEGNADKAIAALQKADPHTDLDLATRVRTDAVFRKSGGDTPAARAATAFGGRLGKPPAAEPRRP